MNNLTGTMWIRRTNGAEIAVVADSEATSGRRGRPVRIKNTTTGRHVWTTPEKLSRRYHQMVMTQ